MSKSLHSKSLSRKTSGRIHFRLAEKKYRLKGSGEMNLPSGAYQMKKAMELGDKEASELWNYSPNPRKYLMQKKIAKLPGEKDHKIPTAEFVKRWAKSDFTALVIEGPKPRKLSRPSKR